VNASAGGRRTILHVDMDAFYASVEARDDPSIRGRPVVVGADPAGGRGVVAAASYEARRYGIRSAMPIGEAYRRCPDAVYLRPRMSRYAEVSDHMFEIFRSFTDQVEPLSLDEAFLDVGASRPLFGDGPTIARTIKQQILERERITASVGVAPSKFLAKLASDLDKPDGLVVVPASRELEFLAPLEVRRLWGAGPRAQERFRSLGVKTIGDVSCLGEEALVRAFGDATGRHFHRLSLGLDDRPVVSGRGRKSLGHENTFHRDVADRAEVRRRLFAVCDEVARRLRNEEIVGRTVVLKLRWEGFETVTRQRVLDAPANTTERLWPVALELLEAADRPKLKVRLVGISLKDLAPYRAGQLSLFAAQEEPVDDRVAGAIDALNDRFGRDSVTRAALLGRRDRPR